MQSVVNRQISHERRDAGHDGPTNYARQFEFDPLEHFAASGMRVRCRLGSFRMVPSGCPSDRLKSRLEPGLAAPKLAVSLRCGVGFVLSSDVKRRLETRLGGPNWPDTASIEASREPIRLAKGLSIDSRIGLVRIGYCNLFVGDSRSWRRGHSAPRTLQPTLTRCSE